MNASDGGIPLHAIQAQAGQPTGNHNVVNDGSLVQRTSNPCYSMHEVYNNHLQQHSGQTAQGYQYGLNCRNGVMFNSVYLGTHYQNENNPPRIVAGGGYQSNNNCSGAFNNRSSCSGGDIGRGGVGMLEYENWGANLTHDQICYPTGKKEQLRPVEAVENGDVDEYRDRQVI